MKKDIQPNVFSTKYTCASCNTSFEILSTKKDNVMIDVCSNCHPFYVGSQSNSSLRGRAEKLSNKFSVGKTFSPNSKKETKNIKKQSKSNIKDNFNSL